MYSDGKNSYSILSRSTYMSLKTKSILIILSVTEKKTLSYLKKHYKK